jgi:Fe-S oxidoreductase
MLKDYEKMVNHCAREGACRVAPRSNMAHCPSGKKFGFDSYYSVGKMEIARSLIRGELEWSSKIADRVYRCLLCKHCDTQCYQAMALRPAEVFLEMRRELVKRGLGPLPELMPMYESVKKYDNPFLKSQKDRGKWADSKLKVKKVDKTTDVLFYVGCAVEFDPTSVPIARALASLLNKAGVNWGIMGEDEICCGFPVLEQGCEDEFKRLAEENIKRINALGVKTIVTACTGCFNTILHEWSRYGKLNCEVIHCTEYLNKLIKEGKLKVTGEYKKKVTIHDPCLLGRYNSIYEPPREILRAIPGINLVEMPRNREEAWCCGAGGGALIGFPEWASETATERLEEAASTGAEVMVVPSCPTCNLNFDVALHGYAAAVKLYQGLWQKTPVAAKFLGVAQKLAVPILSRRKKVDIEVMDETILLDKVTK